MITETQIRQIAAPHLEGTELYLASVKVRAGNRIMVFIDGDSGVSIDDCVKLSRHIESSLDRDREDFELQVSSYGADQPLMLPRQYRRHVGRRLKVRMNEGEVLIGTLEAADDEGFSIKLPASKKEKREEQMVVLRYDEVKETKIEISFK